MEYCAVCGEGSRALPHWQIEARLEVSPSHELEPRSIQVGFPICRGCQDFIRVLAPSGDSGDGGTQWHWGDFSINELDDAG